MIGTKGKRKYRRQIKWATFPSCAKAELRLEELGPWIPNCPSFKPGSLVFPGPFLKVSSPLPIILSAEASPGDTGDPPLSNPLLGLPCTAYPGHHCLTSHFSSRRTSGRKFTAARKCPSLSWDNPVVHRMWPALSPCGWITQRKNKPGQMQSCFLPNFPLSVGS